MSDHHSPDLPDIMSGVLLTGHGGPEKLEWRDDLPLPTLAPSDVLIRVTAAGVNNTDINTRLAWYSKGESASEDASWTGTALPFPFIQGADACGRIVAVGEAVNQERVGERVLVEPSLQEANGAPLPSPWYFGSECNGAFADYTKVAAKHAHAIESTLSDVELASFPCSYSTAENMLTRAGVQKGDIVYITGASGGVGSDAIQLAKARGAFVHAVTSANKADLLRKIGADNSLLRDEDHVSLLGEHSVDVVVDLVAGGKWPTYLQLLRPGGRYAVSGAIAGPLVELDVRTLYLKDLTFFGCTILEPQVFANLVKRIEAKEIKPLVAETYSLRDIAKAQASFTEKTHIGKIVLEVT